MPATIIDCSDPEALLAGVRVARSAVAAGQCIVVPTDTVYGIAADAFSPAAVAGLLAAKGRDRSVPPPVLVADRAMAEALAAAIPSVLDALLVEHWPGALTIVVPASPSLSWDLGDTGGTVALRVPRHPIAIAVLRELGPLAVSSANTHGVPAAVTAQAAAEMLGERVAVMFDAGPVGSPVPEGAANGSTILDCTDEDAFRIVRQGVLPRAAIEAVLGERLVAAP